MRILIVGINYAPELTGVGKYTSELAIWLARRGHQVRVVTAPPSYPNWAIEPGYSALRYSKSTEEGVTVWRCPLWVPKRPSGFKRLIHLGSFALLSTPIVLAQIAWRPQVVINLEPPLFCAPIAWLTARLSGAKAWLHIQDFELDAAFELGLLKGNWLRKAALMLERLIMSGFDRVSTISFNMRELLISKGVGESKTYFLPNWVDLQHFDQQTSKTNFRKKLGIPLGAIVALYSGNMGAKQGLEILAEVAKQCAHSIVFVFCGAGVAKRDLIERCSDLKHVHFLDLQPAEVLSELLLFADIHLLPQRQEVTDLVMPSKLTGMLASSRPVVASADPDSQLGKVVGHCGLLVSSGNSTAFSSALQTLASEPLLRIRLGAAGRAYAEQFLAQEKILTDFEKEIFRA
ncbi:glycosyltransferase WbuB [Polynucleobacter paneuropaeus]|nr:glycosyltransferase WbuB [Polynucleobacter paneuropaeus]